MALGNAGRNSVSWDRRSQRSACRNMEKGCNDLHGMYRHWLRVYRELHEYIWKCEGLQTIVCLSILK